MEVLLINPLSKTPHTPYPLPPTVGIRQSAGGAESEGKRHAPTRAYRAKTAILEMWMISERKVPRKKDVKIFTKYVKTLYK